VASGLKDFERGFGKGRVIELDAGSKTARQNDVYGNDAHTLKQQKLRWLWTPWIPLGAMTFIIADPAAGKSTLLCDLIARVTRGRKWPDGSKAPRGKVLYYSIEENIGGGFLPRLKAAGADLQRVRVVSAEPVAAAPGEFGLRPLPEGIEQISEAIERQNATLVVFDPIADLLPAGADTNSEVAVRASLKSLARLAEETGTALVCVRHLNKKSEAQPLYRMLGSNAFIQMPRAILQIDRDPEDEHGRVLSCIKSSYAKKPRPWRFRLTEGLNKVVRVEWGAALDKREEEELQEAANIKPFGLADVMTQLKVLLAEGEADAKSLGQAVRDAGGSPQMLQRAYRKLGVLKHPDRDEKTGKFVRWLMRLPGDGK